MNTVLKETTITTEVSLDMSAMKMAHIIRKEMCLEGHYKAQMSEALKWAWFLKKGTISIAGYVFILNDGAVIVSQETIEKEAAIAKVNGVNNDTVKDIKKSIAEDKCKKTFKELVEENKGQGILYPRKDSVGFITPDRKSFMVASGIKGHLGNTNYLRTAIKGVPVENYKTKRKVKLPMEGVVVVPREKYDSILDLVENHNAKFKVIPYDFE